MLCEPSCIENSMANVTDTGTTVVSGTVAIDTKSFESHDCFFTVATIAIDTIRV